MHRLFTDLSLCFVAAQGIYAYTTIKATPTPEFQSHSPSSSAFFNPGTFITSTYGQRKTSIIDAQIQTDNATSTALLSARTDMVIPPYEISDFFVLKNFPPDTDENSKPQTFVAHTLVEVQAVLANTLHVLGPQIQQLDDGGIVDDVSCNRYFFNHELSIVENIFYNLAAMLGDLLPTSANARTCLSAGRPKFEIWYGDPIGAPNHCGSTIAPIAWSAEYIGADGPHSFTALCPVFFAKAKTLEQACADTNAASPGGQGVIEMGCASGYDEPSWASAGTLLHELTHWNGITEATPTFADGVDDLTLVFDDNRGPTSAYGAYNSMYVKKFWPKNDGKPGSVTGPPIKNADNYMYLAKELYIARAAGIKFDDPKPKALPRTADPCKA